MERRARLINVPTARRSTRRSVSSPISSNADLLKRTSSSVSSSLRTSSTKSRNHQISSLLSCSRTFSTTSSITFTNNTRKEATSLIPRKLLCPLSSLRQLLHGPCRLRDPHPLKKRKKKRRNLPSPSVNPLLQLLMIHTQLTMNLPCLWSSA